MKRVFTAVLLLVCIATGIVMPQRIFTASALKNPHVDPYGGYIFTQLPAFGQFDKDELGQLYMSGFNAKGAEFSSECVPSGVDTALKLPVVSTGKKVVSTSRHISAGGEHVYDGLNDVNEKTFNGDISLDGHDGIMFWVGNYTDSLYLVIRRSPCSGPYYSNNDELKSLNKEYGIGPYFLTTPRYPDANGYVTFAYSSFFRGSVWWEYTEFYDDLPTLNSIDIVFNNERLNVGDNIYLADFKLYDLPRTERTLSNLVTMLEMNNKNGEYDQQLEAAKVVLETGTEEEKEEQRKVLTDILEPVILRDLYINTYASMENRITEQDYAQTSLTGLYNGMYLRDTSIQTLLHTNQGDTHLSRRALRYLISACEEIGYKTPFHVVSDLYPEVYGNNDGGTPGQYSPIIKLGASATASQVIKSKETVVAVGVWLSCKNTANGMIEAELKRGDTVVSTSRIKVSEIDSAKDYVVFNFPLPLVPVRQGDYTLTLSAPSSPEESVIWYGRGNNVGWETKLNGKVLPRCEASYEAYKTEVYFEYTDTQIDAVFLLANAWFTYVKAAPNTPVDNEFIEQSYPIIKKYIRAYIDGDYINQELKLIKNPFFEHTRDLRKWCSYDLMTNVFASQVFYEFSKRDELLGNTEEAAEWYGWAEFIRQGIETNLTTEVRGKKIYAELIDITHDNKFYQGMSWCNLTPIAAKWYAMDTEMMKRTLEVYAEEATVYYGDIPMLDACYNMFNGDYADHVIGKGYSWELMFSAATGNTERVEQMTEFMIKNTPGSNMYPESWWYPDIFSDVGNQEMASWVAYGMATVYPELKEALNEIRYDLDEDGKVTVADALAVLQRVAFASNYYLNEKEEADLDGDGFATVSDALKVLRKAVGLV